MLELVHRVRDRGVGVIFISHNIITNILDVADRIVVLRLGRRVATFNRSETTHEEIVGAITGATHKEDAA